MGTLYKEDGNERITDFSHNLLSSSKGKVLGISSGMNGSFMFSFTNLSRNAAVVNLIS